MRQSVIDYEDEPNKTNALKLAFDLLENYKDLSIKDIVLLFGASEHSLGDLAKIEAKKILEDNELSLYSQQAELFNLVEKDNYLYHACGLIGEVKECIESHTYDELGDVYWYSTVLINSLKVAFPKNKAFLGSQEVDYTRATDLPTITANLAQMCNKLYRKKDADKYMYDILVCIYSIMNGCTNSVQCYSREPLQTTEEVQRNNIKKLLERYKK